MNEENQISYYSVIPATVRYDNRLKASEKLMYGEIISLTNSMGFCFAKNKYFADLYEVTNGTVSKWLSHLHKLNYINIEIKRNNKKQIVARHIYIVDNPYGQKRLYPYSHKQPYPIIKNDKDNNININIDDLFILIINNNNRISNEFYIILERLEFLYTEDILHMMQESKIQMLKEIIFVLYEIYNSSFDYLLQKVNRESLINLYLLAQERNPKNLLNYYKKLIINEYSNTNHQKE